jgi:hypothetical protein
MSIHNKSKYKHIKNKDHTMTKDIKYSPKLFNKDVSEYKKDVLFSIVYNKNDILYRKTLIDKNTVNKSNLLHLYQMIGIIILYIEKRLAYIH